MQRNVTVLITPHRPMPMPAAWNQSGSSPSGRELGDAARRVDHPQPGDGVVDRPFHRAPRGSGRQVSGDRLVRDAPEIRQRQSVAVVQGRRQAVLPAAGMPRRRLADVAAGGAFDDARLHRARRRQADVTSGLHLDQPAFGIERIDFRFEDLDVAIEHDGELRPEGSMGR